MLPRLCLDRRIGLHHGLDKVFGLLYTLLPYELHARLLFHPVALAGILLAKHFALVLFVALVAMFHDDSGVGHWPKLTTEWHSRGWPHRRPQLERMNYDDEHEMNLKKILVEEGQRIIHYNLKLELEALWVEQQASEV